MKPAFGWNQFLGYHSKNKFVTFSFLLLAGISVSLQIHSAYAIDDYNFVAAGDWGCTSNTDSTISNMISKSPERVLGLGDYSYASTGTCWFNKIAPPTEHYQNYNR